MPSIFIPSTFVGIEDEGTTYRMDHVPLPLKKIVNSPQHCLSDEIILFKILKKIKNLKNIQTKESSNYS